jgi:hypothetical protein
MHSFDIKYLGKRRLLVSSRELEDQYMAYPPIVRLQEKTKENPRCLVRVNWEDSSNI